MRSAMSQESSWDLGAKEQLWEMLCAGGPSQGPWSERNPGEPSGPEAASSRLAERHVSEGLQEGHAVLPRSAVHDGGAAISRK